MYELNTSFRVSNNIAYFSNLILNVLGKEDVNMKGFNDKNKMINHIDKSNPYTILFRNNASIIQHCFENVDEDRKVCFIGGYDSYKFNILLEAYEFLETGRTRNKDFQNFKNYTEMVEFAKKTDNVEIIIIDKLIELYGDRIPVKVKYVKENSTDNQNKAHIVISTGHRSKGSTIKRPLIIGEDFAKLTDLYDKILFGKLNKENLESIINELYLIYVVLTRGAREIEINEDMKKFFVAYYKLNKELFEDKNKMEEN
jgi:F-box protein, helicase, 18